jgi:hypothetical protein
VARRQGSDFERPVEQRRKVKPRPRCVGRLLPRARAIGTTPWVEFFSRIAATRHGTRRLSPVRSRILPQRLVGYIQYGGSTSAPQIEFQMAPICATDAWAVTNCDLADGCSIEALLPLRVRGRLSPQERSPQSFWRSNGRIRFGSASPQPMARAAWRLRGRGSFLNNPLRIGGLEVAIFASRSHYLIGKTLLRAACRRAEAAVKLQLLWVKLFCGTRRNVAPFRLETKYAREGRFLRVDLLGRPPRFRFACP